MKKLIIILISATLLISGCSMINAPDLEDENIATFEVTEATSAPDAQNADNTPASDALSTDSPSDNSLTLEQKFASIDFYMVSGFYSRNVIQDGVSILEMFAMDKYNFVRIAENESEQEVFAYNYLSDDFTYMYYFDGEMMTKTIFNVATGAILEDSEGYTEYLKIDADEIKTYFYALLELADITVGDLN